MYNVHRKLCTPKFVLNVTTNTVLPLFYDVLDLLGLVFFFSYFNSHFMAVLNDFLKFTFTDLCVNRQRKCVHKIAKYKYIMRFVYPNSYFANVFLKNCNNNNCFICVKTVRLDVNLKLTRTSTYNYLNGLLILSKTNK